ncbi:thioredoxin domain-containing protein [Streptomyces sp. NBC_00328]|uniref:thioredoxin domain-containing protein n=1 Tax=Streptomyces sp. NBC_00328 TaxID=2903646 RepID=UPI002E28AC9F|nr:thioredoxin domain-containing protein [Streptomyces sp. NBC_00328]
MPVNKTSHRALVIGAAATALALTAGVGIGLAADGDSAPGTSKAAPLVVPAHTTGDDGTLITYGKASAPLTVSVYEDLRCPYCASFERELGATLTSLADSGKVKVEFHMATFLDKRLDGKGSRTALAALGAALNESPALFKQFHTALYDAQPREETTDTFGSTAELLKIAGKVPGLRTHAFNKAVKEGTYLTWADKVGETFYDSDVTGTPTVKAGGRGITVLDDDGKPVGARQFTEEIEAAAAKR